MQYLPRMDWGIAFLVPLLILYIYLEHRSVLTTIVDWIVERMHDWSVERVIDVLECCGLRPNVR